MSNDTEILEIPQILGDLETHTLSSNGFQYDLPLRRQDIAEEKELKRFIKSCEGMIRHSVEYRSWTDFIKEILGYYSCAITGEVSSQVTTDIHHHPISLYAITKTIIMDKMSSSVPFCSFDIAQAVIELHFQNQVGFVCLARTMHEKFHNGYLSIPMELVQGDFKSILFQYKFDEEDLEIIQGRLEITKENCGWENGQYTWSRNEYNSK